MRRHKAIYTEFAPNLRAIELWMACRMLFQAKKKLVSGVETDRARSWLEGYYQTPNVYTIDSGRSALFIILQALGIGAGDEVILQAYTCVVVPNAIVACGAIPVYADVSERLTMDPESLAQRITDRTKAIIVQHTFGALSAMGPIMALAKAKNIPVIEDCAHALGTRAEQVPAGMIGDAAFVSFGRDKVVSCVRGGAIITRSETLGNKIKAAVDRLPNMPVGHIRKHLAHFPFMAVGIATYRYGIGKLILYMARQTNLVSRAITPQEKNGHMDPKYPTKLPNALAKILLSQLQNLDESNEHRRSIAQIYHQLLSASDRIVLPALTSDTETILRYTIRVKNPAHIREEFEKEHIFLGSWYDTPIAPRDADMKSVRYSHGMCPQAEEAAVESLNLPTDIHVTPSDAAYIASRILSFV